MQKYLHSKNVQYFVLNRYSLHQEGLALNKYNRIFKIVTEKTISFKSRSPQCYLSKLLLDPGRFFGHNLI